MARSEIVNKSSQKDPPVYRSTAIVKFNGYGKTYSYKISDEMVEKLRDKTKVKLGVYVGQDHHKEFKIVDLVRIDEFTLSHLATKEIVSIEECEVVNNNDDPRAYWEAAIADVQDRLLSNDVGKIQIVVEPTKDVISELLDDQQFDECFNDRVGNLFCDAEVDYPAGIECGHSITAHCKTIDEFKKGVLEDVRDYLDYQKEKAKYQGLKGQVICLPKTNEVNLNQKEEINMTNRRVVNVQLLDNDAGLDVDYALVHQWEGIVTEDSNEITIQEIISTGEVAEMILHHNELRSEQVDLEILNRTGQTVNLRPIKLKNLTWIVK